jgi:hypothetical protein
MKDRGNKYARHINHAALRDGDNCELRHPL